MAVFNPDVQSVGIPDENNAVRPSQRVEGNKGPAILGESIGKGLSELGTLYKDTTKVIDYSNKNFLENSIAIDTNRVRDNEIKKNNDNLLALEGKMKYQPDDPEGINFPFSPDVLRKQVSTLAQAKLEDSQRELWYRSRIDILAKEYRHNYPEYRDYIDHVFEKQGFGNTANNVLHAQQQEYLRLNANQSDETKKQLSWILERNKYDPVAANKFYNAVQAGVPGAFDKAMLHLGGIENDKVQAEAFESRMKLKDLSEKNIKDEMSENGTTYARNVVATELFNNNQDENLNTLSGINRYIRHIERDKSAITDDALVQAQATARLAADRVAQNLDAWANEPITYTDQFGIMKKGSRINLMGRDNWEAIKKEALQPIQRITSNIAEGNMPLAHYQAQMVQAYKDNFASGVFHNPTLAGNMLATDFFKNYPEWSKSFFTSLLTDPNVSKIKGSIGGVVMDWTMSMFGPNSPSIKEGMDAIQRQWGDIPAANKALVEGTIRRAADPATPDEPARNAFHALFQEKNYGVTEKMSPNDRAAKFQDMTSEEMAKRAKSLGPAVVKEWSDWTVNEFSQNLLKEEIANLPEIAKNSKVTIGFDSERNRFTLSSGNNHQLELWAPGKLRLLGTGVDPFAIEQYAKTVNRLNAGLGGVERVAEIRGVDQTAFLINAMQAGGHTDNKFWEAMKTHGAELHKAQQQEFEKSKKKDQSKPE